MLTSPPDFFRQAQALKETGASFVIATVVRVRGSASAKTGSKALFSAQGVNLFGYVGGGCAESHVAQEACEALLEKKPRIVEIDLDDEVFGLLPCGGVMDVYLEPHFSSPEIALPNFGAWNAAAAQLLKELGFHCDFRLSPVPVTHWAELFLQLATALAQWKGYPALPLRNTKGRGPLPEPHLQREPPAICVFGHTRITEELVRLMQYFDWRPTLLTVDSDHCEFKIPKQAWVIVASHRQQDGLVAASALAQGADYVALVASEKRARLIAEECSEGQAHFFAPAGLNIPTETPLQIAFSILCEILYLQR